MYNDIFGWLSLSNSLYLNVYKIWGGRRTDMVWTPKPHTGWAGARNQLQILFTVREQQQSSGTRLWLLKREKKNNFIIWFTVKELISFWFFWMWMLGRGGRQPQDCRYSFTTCSFTLNLLLPKGHRHMKRLHGSLQTGLKGVTLPRESCLGLSGASPTAAERDWRAKNRHLLSQKCSFPLQFQSTFCQRPAFAATGFTNVNLSCQAPVDHPPDSLHSDLKFQWITLEILQKEVRQQEDRGKKKKKS